MTQQNKGKNIFQTAMDAVSNRDEKAAIEAAMKRGEELEQKLEEAQQRASQNQLKLSQAEKRAEEAEKKLQEAQKQIAELQTDRAEFQRKFNTANAELQKIASARQAESFAERAKAEAASRIIEEHTLKADETLSHLALKYYGSAYEPYWRVIYEANKELIGDNPGRVRPGMVIKIPVLPEELKKK